MRRKRLQVARALTLLLCGVAAYGQSPPAPGNKKARTPDDYRPRTLKEIASAGTSAGVRPDKEGGVILHGNVLPSRVRATYAGSTRPLPPDRRGVLVKWAQRFAGEPRHYTVPYEAEVLFIEGGAEHWLAVRKNVAARLAKEMKEGEAVDLYVIRLGGVRTAGEWEWLILVENFQKAK